MQLRLLSVAVIATALAGAAPISAQTMMELDQKAGEIYQQADRQLADVYAKLMAKISADSQAKLKQTQETWLRFRDDECTFRTRGTIGGSINSMIFTKYRTALTADRIKDLDYQLNCQQGDFFCSLQ